MEANRANAADGGMDPIADLLGGEHPVFFRPCLARIAGSAAAGILLSQFWFWTNNRASAERDGWFYKTMKEIEHETALTRTEQETARRRLRDLDILEEEKRGLPMKIWFRLNKNQLAEKLRGYAATNLAEILQDDAAEARNQSCGNPARLDAEIPQDIDEALKTAVKTTKKTATASHARESTQQPSAVAAVLKFEESIADPSLIAALIATGLNRSDAEKLAISDPDECRRQLEYLPYVAEFRTSRGAYLASAIRDGYGPPAGWEHARAEALKREQSDRAAHARQVRDEQKRRQEEERETRIAVVRAELEADPARWAKVLTEAEKRLPVPLRGRPDRVGYRPALEAKIAELVAALPDAMLTE